LPRLVSFMAPILLKYARMARYQIRTPENIVIEDILRTLAEKSWEILKAWKVFAVDPDAKTFETFSKALYGHIIPFVRSYKLCGLSNICLDATGDAPWSDSQHYLQASPQDLVYHLFPGRDLEDFLNQVSKAGCETITPILKEDRKNEVFSLLKTTFRTILGEYLYSNPLCGKTELCVYSSSSPQKVMGKKRD